MALEQKLSLKLSQRLVMTPSLQQAIKLLQMTRLELEGVLSQELEENPVLESTDETEEGPEDLPEAEDAEKATDEAPEEIEEGESMEDIDLDAYFNDYLENGDNQSAQTYEVRQAVPIENTLTREPDLYDELLWQLHMLDLPPRQREIAELIIGNLDRDGFLVATVEEIQLLGATPEELAAYRSGGGEVLEPAPGEVEVGADLDVSARLDASERTEEVQRTGASAPRPERSSWSLPSEYVDSEEKSPEPEANVPEVQGPESGEPESEEQQDATAVTSPQQDRSVPGYSRAEVETALEVVRGLDPPGIGYHDLRESLLAQLEARGEDGTLCYRLVDEEWPRVLKRQFPAIAKRFGVPLAELEEPAKEISKLETRPGRRFGSVGAEYVEPDVVVVKVGDEYAIQINDDGMPRLRVSKAYREMLRKLKTDRSENEAQQFIKEKMRSAMWLIKSLDQRQRTIYKVADSIVKQQKGFLERGIEHMRPMVLRDVAEDIGMHESTVSRVVSNKYIHTPRGLFPMKFFFHSGIDRDYGEDISSLTVKTKIRKMIEAEDPNRPLSDSEIMRRLNTEGVNIARRTVAKYRDELNIPSSTDRKKVF